MEDLWIETRLGRVFGRQAGVGDLVLGLHGWSQRNGWHTWEPLMAPLAKAGYCVVSVDMPGWGQSPALGDGRLTPKEAADVVLAILDALEARRVVLMGKSWGGAIALSVALDRPECVDRLILTAPAFRQFERLQSLQQPVLMAWAEDDEVIPVRYAAEYEARVPDLTLVRYEHGGHSAAPKNAADFAPRVISFLES
jgi:pimeloyl-ACP methyl ester carboxylesterase